jgi:hypothetical protein
MRKIALSIAAALACSAAASAGTQNVLLGVASFGPFSTQSLYRIDTATGAASLIGSTGLSNINGIAYEPVTGTLVAYTNAADVFKINVITGAASLIASASGTVPEGDLAIAGSAGYTISGNTFGSLNIWSGAFSPIGDIGPAANDISGLAIDVTGAILGYAKNGSSEDTLVQINAATGLATTIGATGINTASSVGGLAIDPTSGSAFISEGASLYSLNTSTGAASLIGAHGVTGFSGIAFIPTPGAAALLAIVGVAASRRRR